MNCPKCNVPLDEAMLVCKSCGWEHARSSEHKGRFVIFWSLGKVVFWLTLCLAIFFVFWPAISPPRSGPPVGSRGTDIYVAITSANVDREPLGLEPIWPKTQLKPGTDTSTRDIASRVFTNSSDYFYELYDGPNMGTSQHDPYVNGFDFSKLAGPGVPAKVGGDRLTADNNMWAIAANITDEDDDIIPVLITRNVDIKLIEHVVNHGGATSNLDMRIAIGAGKYTTPFGDKGFVCVRKGGGTFNMQSKYATVKVLFNAQTLPPRDPSKPPIVYLMP